MMKLLNILFYTIFVSMLVAIAGLLVASMLPLPNNVEVKIVKSGSMEPAIPTGSLVVVWPQPSYGVGDVITFGEDTKTQIPTTHRIMAVQEVNGETFYTTKGDANEEEDTQPARREEVIGKVWFSAPYAGFILDFARQPLGFALLIGIPAGLVILEEILSIYREARRMLRRRRGENDGDDGGSAALQEIDNAPYMRRRVMDEIFVPMTQAIPKPHEIARGVRYGMLSFLVAYMSIGGLSLLGAPGTTLSYFADIETSIGNFFRAGFLDFTLAGGVEATIKEGDQLFFESLFTPEPDSFPTAYRIIVEQTGGDNDFCNALDVLATTTPNYNGSLIGLITATTTVLTPWQFSLLLPDDTGLTNGDECLVDLVYQGWHQNNLNYNGFTDEERVPYKFIFEATADPQSVVLNEFLPNPDNSANGMDLGNDSSNMPLGEWIELYNNGDVKIDVTGWFMTDASGGVGNTHAVITSANTFPATTTIPAHGWLVVYLNKPSLNNTGDEIYLFTATSTGSVEVDFYSYDDPSDFCELELTPGGTNATSTPSGTPGTNCISNQVAPNKSYARIPDGTGAWVDPIPTPGAANVPDPVPDPEPEETPAPEGGGGGGGGGSGESSEAPAVEEGVEEVPLPEAPAPEGSGPSESIETPPVEEGAETPVEEPAGETTQTPADEPSETPEEVPAPPAEEPQAEEVPAEAPVAEEPPAETSVPEAL